MGVVVLLKGATTVVAHLMGDIFKFYRESWNGYGGSGDVLTGLIAALVAQGYSTYDAAVYGSFIHGRAGDYAMKKKW